MQRGGKPRKFDLGPWLMPAFKLLAKLRWLRGSRFDPFAWQSDRRLERQLIEKYERTLDLLLAGLRSDNLQQAAEIASMAEKIRGYGHIKQANAEQILPQWDSKLTQFGGKSSTAQPVAPVKIRL